VTPLTQKGVPGDASFSDAFVANVFVLAFSKEINT
jgi:hypothetical protein